MHNIVLCMSRPTHIRFSLFSFAVPLVVVLSLFASNSYFVFATDSEKNIKPIISVDWLLKSKRENYLIIDVRDLKDYLQEHIENAIHIPIENTFNQKGDTTRIAPIYQVQTFLSAVGVNNSDYIIIYDNGDFKNAAHFFWLLETYNHKKVSVLGGGYPGWIKNKGPVTTEIKKRPTSKYIASISSHSIATKLTTRLAIENTNTLILDSRSHEEYSGLSSKARRKGHIPKSINIPWNENLVANEKNNSVKSTSDLETIYSSINKDKEVIAYCNRGKQSAVTYLIMRNMGYKVSIYDGGWLEWGNDPALPVINLVR